MTAWIIQGIGIAVLVVCGVPIVVAELRGRGVLRFGSSYAEDYLEFLDSEPMQVLPALSLEELEEMLRPRRVYDQERDAA